ncbi:MAG: UDP-N-acetylmuramoyl-tripeptide--D-alanyl-D-alanine ligase [Paracoccaceae bacterium]
MSRLWTGSELAKATGAAVSVDGVDGISIDTRSLKPGDLFVALQDQRDGHDFVAHALQGGAAAALVARDLPGVAREKLIIVANPLAALGQLAAAARARSAAKVVAVTGSVGKTGTKDMLRIIFADQGRVHAAEKSYNNHWGVPLTLARMPRDTEFAVIELGMNHPGEIAPLARLARPHVALITTVAAVHAGAFETLEAIADEKASIFEGLEKGGIAVLPADNAHFARLSAKARQHAGDIISFGGTDGATFRQLEARPGPTATVINAHSPDGPFLFKLGAPGLHLAMNALGALAAAHAAGADLARAALALAIWRAPEGRGARLGIALGPSGMDGQITLIDESYNANPSSMGAALDVLTLCPVEDGIGRVAAGRRIAILGDMLELGQDELSLHAALAHHGALENITIIHCVGPRMHALYKALPGNKRGQWFENAQACAAKAAKLLDAGDVVMVKGSLGAAMRHVVDAIKNLGECSPLDQSEGA